MLTHHRTRGLSVGITGPRVDALGLVVSVRRKDWAETDLPVALEPGLLGYTHCLFPLALVHKREEEEEKERKPDAVIQPDATQVPTRRQNHASKEERVQT